MRRPTLSPPLLALCISGLLACATAPRPREAEPEEVTAEQPQAEAPAPEDAWRATPPQPGQEPALVLPTFQRARLPNGLSVLVSTRRELPLVSMSIACKSGSASDPQGKAGLASISFQMLLEGAAGRNALQLDEAFGQLGASPGAGVSTDGGSVGTTVLKRNADGALQLLADVVRRPTLAPADFQRRKQQTLANLAQAVSSPNYLAQEAFTGATFGAAHPYGHLSSGTPRSVGALTLADVRGFLGQRVGPRTCALVAAGDVSLEEAQAWAKRYFGDWKGAATPPRPPAAPRLAPRQQVLLVPKPGLNQTLVLLGRPAIPVGHPDEEALLLATRTFGGFFGSRLNMNLREARGYTYGASAGVDPRRGVGPLSASSQVRGDVTGPAVQEFFNELRGLAERPISEQELEEAREGIIRALPSAFDSVESLAATAASLFIRDQPLDRLERRVKGLRETDLARVRQAATTYYAPELMQLVLVGDPATVRTQVEQLGLGPIQEVAPPAPRTSR